MDYVLLLVISVLHGTVVVRPAASFAIPCGAKSNAKVPVLGRQSLHSGLQPRPELTSCRYWAIPLTSLFPIVSGKMIEGAMF